MFQERFEGERSSGEIRSGAAPPGDAVAPEASSLDEEPLAVARCLGKRLPRPACNEQRKQKNQGAEIVEGVGSPVKNWVRRCSSAVSREADGVIPPRLGRDRPGVFPLQVTLLFCNRLVLFIFHSAAKWHPACTYFHLARLS